MFPDHSYISQDRHFEIKLPFDILGDYLLFRVVNLLFNVLVWVNSSKALYFKGLKIQNQIEK
jgi:hypothetical protein